MKLKGFLLVVGAGVLVAVINSELKKRGVIV